MKKKGKEKKRERKNSNKTKTLKMSGCIKYADRRVRCESSVSHYKQSPNDSQRGCAASNEG